MPDQESVSFDIDPRSVLGAIKQMNAAMDGYEKGSTSANANLQKAIERTSDLLLKVNDRSRNSLERLTQSIEKQAAAYGKSGVERLTAERDRMIKKLGDEQGMIDRVTAAYAKMIAAESEGAGGAGKMGASAMEAKASLALMGEEMGVHIPRHIRGFITMLPGVGQALDSAFKAVAVIAIIAVLYEVTKKVIELHRAIEEMHLASERAAAEFQRFNDAQKLTNDELKVTNDKLENAIAKLAHKPENNLKLAIDEAAVAADRLAERLDKSLHSFLELVQKNAPGAFATIIGGQVGTSDIKTLVGGKSGFGGLIGDLYKATENGGNPTTVLDKYRAEIGAMIRQSEFAQAYQQGKGFEGVGYGEIRGAMSGRGKLPSGLYFENMLADQGPRLETLNALVRQIDLLQESYTLEKKNTTLTAQHQAAEGVSSTREMEQEFVKRMTEVEMGPVAKIFAERDDLVRKGANSANINDAALTGASKELAKEQAEADKQNRQMQLKGAEYEAKQWDELYKNLEQNNAETFKHFKEMAQTGREILDIGVTSERGMITSESARAGRMTQLGVSGPGHEMESIAATYQERVGLAQKLHTFEMDRASKELDLNKQKVDQARAEADLRNGMYEAGVDAELKIAELQKRRTDELAKTSTALWNTLLTKPGDFGKELSGTIHAAVLKPVTEGLGNLTANALKPVIYGADGMGGVAGMFGGMFGRQDPIKTATDQNTLATRQNSQAMYMLSALLARASGVSISSLATPAFLPGMETLPRFAKGGVTNGPSIVGEDGPELVIPLGTPYVPQIDLRPTRNRPLVGTYGPETDAALLKAAESLFGIAMPAGLSALGGPAGFSVGETILSTLMGGIGVATPARTDSVLEGVLVPRGGKYSAPDEGYSMFGKETYEDLKAIGGKGGRISGLARTKAAAERDAARAIASALRAEERDQMMAEKGLYSDAKYKGPEPPDPNPEPTHAASANLDDQFPWLKGAFDKSPAKIRLQEAARRGGQAKSVWSGQLKIKDVQGGSLKWAIDPKTNRVRLSPFVPDGAQDAFETHADWFEKIGLPSAGTAFDRVPRGYANITSAGKMYLQDNALEFGWERGSTAAPVSRAQFDDLVAAVRRRLPWVKLPSYDEGGTVANTGLAMVHQGETVLPPSDTLKRAIDLNTAATVKAAQASQASAMYMAGVAASITSSVLGIVGLAAPAVAAAGGVVPNVGFGSGSATGAPGGGTAVLSDLANIVGGPGGTSGFVGPVRVGGGGAGGSRTGGSAGLGGFAGLFKNLKTTDWGGFTRKAATYSVDADGNLSPIDKSKITGMHGAAGAAMFAGGSMLAQQGLLGSSRGTWGGVAEGTLGGAAIGMSVGGPLGAAIGGAVGLGIGLGEKLAGVESKESEAKRLVKQLYSISIDNSMAKQIVGIAQQKYAGNVGIAVRDPDVRKMLMLYSEASGQKMPLSATTPMAGSLAEVSGKLYQQANYVNGTPYTFRSSLPVEGGYGGGSSPAAGPMTLQVNVSGQGAAQFVAGQVVTPEFVQAQWSSAAAGSNGRLQNSAVIQQPGLVIS